MWPEHGRITWAASSVETDENSVKTISRFDLFEIDHILHQQILQRDSLKPARSLMAGNFVSKQE